MVNHGKKGTSSFGKLLNDSNTPINAFWELLKSLFGFQRKHTLPAIILALKDQLKIHESEKFIEVGNQLRQELQAILGTLFYNYRSIRIQSSKNY
jgi:hypothetical protein